MLCLIRTYATQSARTLLPCPPSRGKTVDVQSFLKQIGRKSESLADKFKGWEHLFSARSRELKEAGLTPQQRKYILFWTDKYRQGVTPKHIKSTR